MQGVSNTFNKMLEISGLDNTLKDLTESLPENSQFLIYEINEEQKIIVLKKQVEGYDIFVHLYIKTGEMVGQIIDLKRNNEKSETKKLTSPKALLKGIYEYFADRTK